MRRNMPVELDHAYDEGCHEAHEQITDRFRIIGNSRYNLPDRRIIEVSQRNALNMPHEVHPHVLNNLQRRRLQEYRIA